MKSRFTYLRPSSLAEVCTVTAAAGPGTRLLAGGTDLYLEWRGGAPIQACVDISRLPGLAGITQDPQWLRIGALTTLRTLERAALAGGGNGPLGGSALAGGGNGPLGGSALAGGGNGPLGPGATAGPELAALAALARVMCTPATRSLATVGGNLGNASPGADLPPALLALDAEIVVTGPAGVRSCGVGEFCTGPGQTSLVPGEVITSVEIPLRPRRAVSVLRATRTTLDIAQVIVAVSVAAGEGGLLGPVGVALGAVGPAPIRAAAAEVLLTGRALAGVGPEDLAEAARLAGTASRPIDDVRAGAEYRREITRTLTRRALTEALGRLREEGDR